ncbi:hypothetical protein MCUN1_003117 [Malassezia cuniculi]|uniref:DUF202 domain-containing protein n=1 Tax=Malassezia cuniculi TaxID=948313 RepID=A0AAF0J7Z3_9BASI|nr:hypothetical protein MCUN1_003117 [Malassezia cuniculi]
MLSATLTNTRELVVSFFSKKQTTRRGMYRFLSSDDKLDLRAAQRTFDGAYLRTALGEMSFSLTILRIFQREFFWVGIACCILAFCLIVIAVFRYEMSLRYENEFLNAALLRQFLEAQEELAARNAPDQASISSSRASLKSAKAEHVPNKELLHEVEAISARASIDGGIRRRNTSTSRSRSRSAGASTIRGNSEDVTDVDAQADNQEAAAEESPMLLPLFWTAGYTVLFTVLATFAVDVAIIVLLARM